MVFSYQEPFEQPNASIVLETTFFQQKVEKVSDTYKWQDLLWKIKCQGKCHMMPGFSKPVYLIPDFRKYCRQ